MQNKKTSIFRRIYIVDRGFQWTVIGYSLTISLLTSFLHYTISRLEIFGRLSPVKTIALYGGFYLALTWIAVLFSNRLAGPIFRLRRHMNDVAKGRPAAKIFFREKDYFSSLNAAYNALVDSLPAERKGKNEKGFTLVEILMAVAIVSILTGLSVSTFIRRPQDSASMRSEITKLKSALTSARNAAINKSQCAVVTVVNSQTVSVKTYAIPSPCTSTPLPAADYELTERFAPATVVSDFSTGDTLTFKPSGGLTVPATVNISIKAGGMSNQLVIYPVIGQVRQL